MSTVPGNPGLRISLLGSPVIEIDGHPLAVDTRKAIALLAVLALEPGPHERQWLASLLWSEGDDAHAQSALRRTLSTLNGALGHRGLHITRETVALADDGWCDVTALDHAIAAARRGDTSSLGEAVALVRGDLLQGFALRDSPAFDDWLRPRADAARRNVACALEQLAESALDTGDHATAIAVAGRWLATDPLQEAAHRLLMRAYLASGDRTSALRQYRDCVRILETELGVPPVDETRALYRTIRGETAAPAGTAMPPPASSKPGGRPFVGRSTELRLLSRLLRAATPTGCLVLIEGEAGAGKSRLIEAIVTQAQATGTAALTARCFESESTLPYAAAVELLKGAVPATKGPGQRVDERDLWEASRLLPALAPSASAPTSSDGPGAYARLLEGVASVLAAAVTGRGSGMIVVDDAQWLDSASTEVLGYLARHLREGTSIVVVLGVRTGDPFTDGLGRLVSEAERAGTLARLPLRRLEESEVAEWASLALGGAASADFSRRLAVETEGLPLLVAEYLAEASSGGGVTPTTWTLPSGARELLQQRVAGLGELEWQILSAASVAGRSSGFDLLRSAAGRSEDETLGALEYLLRRALIRERPANAGEPAWEFTHDKLRELVYDQLTATRRRLLHRRIADFLSRSGGQPGAVAHHLQRAGDDERAAYWFQQAGDAARALFAHDEALAYYESARALGSPDPVALREAIGDIHLLRGAFDAALLAYEAAASGASATELPRIEHRLGRVYLRIGEWSQAEDYFAAAIEGAGVTSALRASVLADWSQSALRRGDGALAQKCAADALRLAAEAGDEVALARARITRGMLARRRSELPAARDELGLALAAASASNNLALHASALNNLALVELDANRPKVALELGYEALELVRRQGDLHALAAVHSNLADFHWAAGESAEAESELRQSVGIYADIGVVGGAHQPEIWKLVDW